MKIEVADCKNKTLSCEKDAGRVTLVHPGCYHKGDRVVFTCDIPGWYELCLEDTLPVTMVYVEKQAVFHIPFQCGNKVRSSVCCPECR